MAFQFCEYGYTEGKIYGYTDNSFGGSDAQSYGVSVGLPRIILGNQWKIDSDIGVDFFRPHSNYYDDTAFNFKVKFIQDNQFSSFCPAFAFGSGYLGGAMDLYIHPSDPFAPFYPNRAIRKARKSPCLYIVRSKNIHIKWIEPQVTAGFMWNNFGQPDEDVIILGFSEWILPNRIGLMVDYYGGRFGNYGVGVILCPHKLFDLGISYLIPKDKDYPMKNYQSESLWIFLTIYIPIGS